MFHWLGALWAASAVFSLIQIKLRPPRNRSLSALHRPIAERGETILDRSASSDGPASSAILYGQARGNGCAHDRDGRLPVFGGTWRRQHLPSLALAPGALG